MIQKPLESKKTIFKDGFDSDIKVRLSEARSKLQEARDGPNMTAPNRPLATTRESLSEYISKLEQEEKLDHLLEKSNKIIFRCKTVFPFDLFPDTLILDERKVNIIYKEFFLSENVHGMLIESILDVQIEAGVLFAKMKIISNLYPESAVSIEYLRKSDAYEARRLIQGIIVCKKEGIDLAKLDLVELKDKIREVGTAV